MIVSLVSILLVLCCSPSHAEDYATLQSETAEELLMFYDWDELLVEAPSRRPTQVKEVAANISIVTAEEIKEMNVHSVNEILMRTTASI